MSEHVTPSWRHIRREFLLALALALFALFVFSLFSLPSIGGFRSAELKFTDASHGGLAIVPASCPSNPHFAGDCTTTPPPPATGCNITAGNDYLMPGDSTSLAWSVAIPSGSSSDDASITPDIGPVPSSGSRSIQPIQTTTYTLSGTYTILFGLITNGSFSCSHTVNVGICPPGQFLQNGQCVALVCPPGSVLVGDQCMSNSCRLPLTCVGNSVHNSCTNTDTLCPAHYTCSDGRCLGPGRPTGQISAVPQLIRSGDKAQVTWSTTEVDSCSVTGNNGDSWSGASGSQTSSSIKTQTTYTLSCIGLDGSTLTQTATVNLIPVFQEL